MKNDLSLAQLKFDVWLIEQLQNLPAPGLTLEELKQRWASVPGHVGALSRDKLTRHRHNIRMFLDVEIQAPDRKHYRITNPEKLHLDSLANDLLKSIQNYAFLQEYKNLGDLIQPEQIENGARYLQLVGQALRDKRKLRIKYQKFADTETYDAIIRPYCLKAHQGRWYILAYKEGSTHSNPLQTFALDDRTEGLTLTSETFVPDPDIDVSTYFRDCFGIWRDFEHYPVRDITISCSPQVAQYLRTLPLHHSQKESQFREGEEGWFSFQYHLSPSPDFIGELMRWGKELIIKD